MQRSEDTKLNVESLLAEGSEPDLKSLVETMGLLSSVESSLTAIIRRSGSTAQLPKISEYATEAEEKERKDRQEASEKEIKINSDIEQKEGKDRRETSERAEAAAKMTLNLIETCTARIQYNLQLLNFLEAPSERSIDTYKQYLQINESALYPLILKQRWDGKKTQAFVKTLIQNHLDYYKEILKRLKGGDLDEAYLLLKSVINRSSGKKAKRTRGILVFERERDVQVKMLKDLDPFISSELESLKRKQYITYVVENTSLNSKLTEQDKRKTFSIQFEQIRKLEIIDIKTRVDTVVKLIERSFSEESLWLLGADVLRGSKKLLKSSELSIEAYKTIEIVDSIDQKFFEKINALFIKTSKKTSDIINTILVAFDELKKHIRVIRKTMLPLVTKLEDIEALVSRLVIVISGLEESRKNVQNLIDSEKWKRQITYIKHFLETSGSKEIEAGKKENLLGRLKQIEVRFSDFFEGMQKFELLIVPRNSSVEEEFNTLLSIRQRKYLSLRQIIEEFNTSLKTEMEQLQSKVSTVLDVASSTTMSTVAEENQGTELQLPTLPRLKKSLPIKLTKLEQTRLAVEQERSLNKETLLTQYRTLSENELKLREDRVKTIALSSNIKSRFVALYAGEFSHTDLEMLVGTLREKGESISINYPGNGCSHCTLCIRVNTELLSDPKSNIEFVEKAGSWKMQVRKQRAGKNNYLPTRLLKGVQNAFRRAGYTEAALGLIPDSNSSNSELHSDSYSSSSSGSSSSSSSSKLGSSSFSSKTYSSLSSHNTTGTILSARSSNSASQSTSPSVSSSDGASRSALSNSTPSFLPAFTAATLSSASARKSEQSSSSAKKKKKKQ